PRRYRRHPLDGARPLARIFQEELAMYGESPIPPLGVGLAYQPALRSFIDQKRDSFDYLETVPDILWTDLGIGRTPRYVDDEEGLAFLRRASAGRPMIPHATGLPAGPAPP